jgi:cytochrome o ubiquinol oxidase subunit 3
MTDCILFASFFAAYAVLQVGTNGGPGPKELFSLPFALQETLILLVSSFTCGLATINTSKKKLLIFFTLTFILGAAFMYMELTEFNRLIADKNTWQTSAFLSSYFTLIGIHGLHIVVGLLFMVIFMAQMCIQGLDAVLIRRINCLRMYWHFVYLIWIFTFSIVYLIGVAA